MAEETSMATSGDGEEVTEKGLFGGSSKNQEDKEDTAKEKDDGGFMGRIKGFVKDVGEKIGFGKPTATVSGFHLPNITLERADVVVDVLINNPNPIPIPLVDIEYLIESDGRKLVSGTIPDAGTIHAYGSETVKIPISLIYKDIEDTYDDIKPGAVIPYRVRVALIVDVPVLGRLTLPLEKTGEMPVPYKPDVDVDDVEWEKLSLEQTEAIVHLKIENKNKFQIGVTHLSCDLSLAGTNIAKASLGKCAKIGEEGVGHVDLPISFRPKDFGGALWDMIRGRGAGYSLVGKLEVDTPFGPMQLPFDKQSTTKLKKKEGAPVEDDDNDGDKEKKAHSHWFSSREAGPEAEE